MKINKSWFLLGSLMTVVAATIRFMVERIVQVQGYSIVVGAMDLFLLASAIVAFGVFYNASRNRWAEPRTLGFSYRTYSFSHGVLMVWAAFLIAIMVYKLSGLSG